MPGRRLGNYPSKLHKLINSEPFIVAGIERLNFEDTELFDPFVGEYFVSDED
jgi:hypothetical protein